MGIEMNNCIFNNNEIDISMPDGMNIDGQGGDLTIKDKHGNIVMTIIDSKKENKVDQLKIND